MDHWVEELATRVNDSETNTEHKVTKIKLNGISSNWEAPSVKYPFVNFVYLFDLECTL